MGEKNLISLPLVIFLPAENPKFYDRILKFILAKINTQFSVVVAIGDHKEINAEFAAFLHKNNYSGEYEIHGGGRILIAEDRVEAEGDSGWFGLFDGQEARKCLEWKWPEKNILTIRTKPNRITKLKVTESGDIDWLDFG